MSHGRHLVSIRQLSLPRLRMIPVGKNAKKRASHPKVRSGCQTCKIRHKKCDETHPSCLMCTSTGRVCEYIETPDRRKRAMREIQVTPAPNFVAQQLLPRRLVDPSQIDLSPIERRYLDLFRVHTSRKCTGGIVDDFWQRLVHQVAEEEPAVRHAAIAISSIHWQFLQEAESTNSESLSRANPSVNKSSSFTLVQCTKALVSLRQRLTVGGAYATSSAHREAMLVTCIMLVSLSLFQADVKAVTSHLRSGYTVLMEWQRVNFDGNPSGMILMRAFSDLQLHRITFSLPQRDVEADELPLWQTITACRPVYGSSTVSERDFSIAFGAMIATNYPKGLELRVGSSLQRLTAALADLLYQNKDSWKKTLVERMMNWKNEFHAFISTHRKTLLPQDRGPMILIELWTELSDIIYVSLNEPLDEMSYDSSLFRFQRMNELAALYLNLAEQVSMFSTKPMLLHVLHFCATKCRDWHTRRETLRLVHNSPRREGLWTSSHIVATLEHVFKQESAGLTPDDVVPRTSRIGKMYVSPIDQSKISLWYHRPCTSEEVANGADIYGKWTNVVISI